MCLHLFSFLKHKERANRTVSQLLHHVGSSDFIMDVYRLKTLRLSQRLCLRPLEKGNSTSVKACSTDETGVLVYSELSF